MPFKYKASVLPLVLIFALAACGEDRSTNPGQNLTGCALLGKSTINVSNAVTATLNSCTMFSVSSSGGGGAQLLMRFQSSSQEQPSHTLILNRQGNRPATGSYTSGSGPEQFAGLFSVNTEPNRTFVVANGTLTITTSTATTLAGSLNLTGTEVGASGTPPTVTISGSFSAKCIDTSGSNC